MALPKLGLNEGSLLRRTLLHVATFLVGSIAFVSLVSFVLVSVARGLGPHSDASADGEDGDSSSKGLTSAKTSVSGVKSGLNKKKTTSAPKDE